MGYHINENELSQEKMIINDCATSHTGLLTALESIQNEQIVDPAHATMVKNRKELN